MRLTRTSGSEGGLGGRPPRSTRPVSVPRDEEATMVTTSGRRSQSPIRASGGAARRLVRRFWRPSSGGNSLELRRGQDQAIRPSGAGGWPGLDCEALGPLEDLLGCTAWRAVPLTPALSPLGRGRTTASGTRRHPAWLLAFRRDRGEGDGRTLGSAQAPAVRPRRHMEPDGHGEGASRTETRTHLVIVPADESGGRTHPIVLLGSRAG